MDVNHVFPIFVGSGRSGTTLFRNVFDSHPELAMTHEAHFIAPLARRGSRYATSAGFDVDGFVADLYANSNFRRQGLEETEVRARLAAEPSGTVADAIRSVMATYAAKEGKPLYGDKTPGYVIHLDVLAETFPEARFVHIIRDGRDVAMAYLDRDEWGPSSMGDAAHYWRSRVSRGRRAGKALGARYREVRYEDMVDDPEAVTRDLCDFLGLTFDPSMLRFHEKGASFIAESNTPEAFQNLAKPITKGMRDWRIQMAPDDVALFEGIAGDLLDELGYEVTGVSMSPAMRGRLAYTAAAWQGKRVTSRLEPMWRKAQSRLQKARG